MKKQYEVIMVKFESYRYHFCRIKLFEIIKLISLACILTQTRIGEGVHLYSGGLSSDFIKMCSLSCLECAGFLIKTRMCAWLV